MESGFDNNELMYKLVVISDIHGDVVRLERLLPIINAADYLVFCGDGIKDILRVRGLITVPIVCVKGNCDFVSDITELATTKFGDTRVLITHGHRFGTKQSVNLLIGEAIKKHCNLVFFGHSHVYFDRIENGIHLINPGALCNGSYALVAGDGINFVSKQHFI